MRVNEVEQPWMRGLTLAAVRDRHKPDADVVVLNGFPVDPEAWDTTVLSETDALVLIRRGEKPRREELTGLLAARHTPGVAEVLRKACVGIAGVGGLGSNAAHALTRIGVGHLVFADFDVVEPSNLNRQAYRIDQIGMRKVDALAADLAGIHPWVRLTSHAIRLTPETIPVIFGSCTVILECFDRPDQKAMLVETVLGRMPGVQVVAASGVAGTGDGNRIQVRALGRRLWMVGDGVAAAMAGCGLMAPRVLVAAGQQANLAVRILLGEEDVSAE